MRLPNNIKHNLYFFNSCNCHFIDVIINFKRSLWCFDYAWSCILLYFHLIPYFVLLNPIIHDHTLLLFDDYYYHSILLYVGIFLWAWEFEYANCSLWNPNLSCSHWYEPYSFKTCFIGRIIILFSKSKVKWSMLNGFLFNRLICSSKEICDLKWISNIVKRNRESFC